jgi:peptidoglycan/LPS O-acetylase OafA/YrhL
MYIQQIVFIKFLAAATVVIYHYGINIYPFNLYPFNQLIPIGPIAVSFFFALSGFILAFVYYHKEKPGIEIKKFYASRFARIYPMFLIALVPCVIYSFGTSNNGISALILNILLLQSLIPPYPLTFNPPAWALSVEMVFYILFPFILLFILKYGKKRFLIAAITLWIISQMIHGILLNGIYRGFPSKIHDFLYYSPLLHLNTFVLGCYFGSYFKDRKKQDMNKYLNFGVLLFSIAGIIFVLLIRKDVSTILGVKIALTNGMLAPLFLLFVLSLARDKTIITGILKNKYLAMLGESSYCMYILQFPVKDFFYNISYRLIDASDHQRFYLYFLTLVIASVFFHTLIESQLRKVIISFFQSDTYKQPVINCTLKAEVSRFNKFSKSSTAID